MNNIPNKFHTPINIYEFSDVKSFVEAFKIGSNDVILTHKFLADPYFKSTKIDCSYIYYEDYEAGEPSEDGVDAMRKVLNDTKCKRLVAVGGGSVLDAAKVLALKAKATSDIYETSFSPVRNLPLVLVPTTCGTGSETSNIAVIYMNSIGNKIGKSGTAFFSDASVLIPQLLENLPYDIFMYSALDALIHSIEVYLSPNAHPFSNVYCAEALRLIVRNFRKMRDNGKDMRKECLIDFLRASSYAGIGLSNNPCGAIHACAMVFGGMHHTPHGMTNAIFMNSVLNRYAKKHPKGEIRHLVKIICEELDIRTDVSDTFDRLSDLINGLIVLDPLSKFGMEKTFAKAYAEKVLNTQQRLIVNSYLPLSVEDFKEIFEELCT